MRGIQTGYQSYAATGYESNAAYKMDLAAQPDMQLEEKQKEVTADKDEALQEEANSEKPVQEMSYSELSEYIRSKAQEIYEKLKNGETKVKIQIGGMEFTDQEWEKLLKRVDDAIDAIKDEQEKEKEAREKKEAGQKQDSGVTADSSLLEAMEDLAEEIAKERSVEKTVSAKEEAETRLAGATSGKKEESEGIIADLTDLMLGMVMTEQAAEISSQTDKQGVLYVTSITAEGISCKSSAQKPGEAPLWQIPFHDADSYQKVMHFLNQFDADENLSFASNQRFWQDLINGDIDQNEFYDFYEGIRSGSIKFSELKGETPEDFAQKLKQMQYILEQKEGTMVHQEIDLWEQVQKNLASEEAAEAKRTQGKNQYDELFAHTPASVRQAWEQAAAGGVDGFMREADRRLNDMPQLIIERLLGDHQDYSALLGSSVASAYQFAERVIGNLEAELANQPGMDANKRAWKEKEMQFYQKFMENLKGL